MSVFRVALPSCWSLACHDGRTLSGVVHGLYQRCARCATAEHEHFTLYRLRHDALRALRMVSLCRVLRLGAGHPMRPWLPHRWNCLARRVPLLKQPGRRRCTSRQGSRGFTHDGRSAIAVRNRGAVGGVTKTTRQCRDADTAAWTADVRESARAIARRLEAITGVETRDQCSLCGPPGHGGSHATRTRHSARQGECGTTGSSRQERRDGWGPPIATLPQRRSRLVRMALTASRVQEWSSICFRQDRKGP